MRIKDIPLNNTDRIVYFPDSLRFFVVNDETFDIIKEVHSGLPYSYFEQKYSNLSQKDYARIKSYCDEIIDIGEDKADSTKKVLSRLVLNISNACNMQCKYCYANGGTYGSDERLMSIEILEKTLNLFYNKFDVIESIQLFGGEPALNIEAIDYTCNYVKQHNKSTSIGMVTNGTALTDDLIEIIVKNNITVTVSIDCIELHDSLRPFNSGKGTYEIIKNNIKKLRESVGEPRQFEVTYTKMHDNKDISISKLLESLKKDLGEDVAAHVAPVCTNNPTYELDNPERFVDSVNDYFKYIGTEKEMHYSFVDRFLNVFKDRQIQNTYCGGGIGTLAVAANGDLYPCFYFVDNNEFIIGNVKKNSSDELDSQIDVIRNKYLNYNRRNSGRCKDCYANTVCFGCLGINYSMSGDVFASSDFHCDMVKSGLEATLKNIIKRREQEGHESV